MIPTITANIEPHVRLSVTEDEPAPVEEKFVDLECGVTESPCCEYIGHFSEPFRAITESPFLRLLRGTASEISPISSLPFDRGVYSPSRLDTPAKCQRIDTSHCRQKYTKRKSAATETEGPFACSRHVCATQTAAHRPTDRAHTHTDRHTHNTTHKFPLSNTAQTTYLLPARGQGGR